MFKFPGVWKKRIVFNTLRLLLLEISTLEFYIMWSKSSRAWLFPTQYLRSNLSEIAGQELISKLVPHHWHQLNSFLITLQTSRYLDKNLNLIPTQFPGPYAREQYQAITCLFLFRTKCNNNLIWKHLEVEILHKLWMILTLYFSLLLFCLDPRKRNFCWWH